MKSKLWCSQSRSLSPSPHSTMFTPGLTAGWPPKLCVRSPSNTSSCQTVILHTPSSWTCSRYPSPPSSVKNMNYCMTSSPTSIQCRHRSSIQCTIQTTMCCWGHPQAQERQWRQSWLFSEFLISTQELRYGLCVVTLKIVLKSKVQVVNNCIRSTLINF